MTHQNSPLLAIDFAHMYADAGVQGVTPAELVALQNELARAHQTLKTRSTGGIHAEYACLDLHDHMTAELPAIRAAAENLRRFDDLVIIGIGGSNLGVMAVYEAVGPTASTPRLHFADNIEPDRLPVLMQKLKPARTGVVVISKSGGTIESAAQYMVLRTWLAEHLGQQAAGHQFIITDPVDGWLRKVAIRDGVATLPVPPKVGGRYSVLTAVGLLPLAVVGIDIERLLAGSAANAARCHSDNPSANPALHLAALYYLLDVHHGMRTSIVMPYVSRLRLFGDWYRQLWAESLGKLMADGTPAGTLPVPALGAIDQHSQLQMYLASRRDKIFAFMALARYQHTVAIPLGPDAPAFPYLAGKSLNDVIDAEFRATRQVITGYGHPNLTLRLPALDAHTLGQLIDLYQRTTVYAGLLYGVNPLDQPAVESGKQLTLQYLRGAS